MSTFLKKSRAIHWLFSGALMFCAHAASAMDQPPLSSGQTIYVPVYSSVLHGNLNDRGTPEQILLSSMLSVRNTDPYETMTLTSVEYFDSAGKLLRQYLTKPLTMAPLETVDFFVENRERQGGTGANFIVIWKANDPINPPIMETVQVYHWGTQGQSFTSRGQVIHTKKPIPTSPGP